MIGKVTHNSKTSKKRKRKHDHTVDEDTTSRDFVNLGTESPPESERFKKKRKKKTVHNNAEIQGVLDSSVVVEQEGRKEKKKKHRKSEIDSLGLGVADQDNRKSIVMALDATGLFTEDDGTSQKKDSLPLVDAALHETTRKGRKHRHKQKSLEESTLGMVDTDILQQAKTNFGLPLIDNLETETLKNDKLNESDVKKEKKKKKKEKKLKEASSDTPNVGTRNDRALQYLRLWGSHRKSWKFNKMMQIQLLHIMYDQSVLSDDDFESLLLYLDGLKGKGRERTKEDAKKILDQSESEDAVDANKEERARQIYQILS